MTKLEQQIYDKLIERLNIAPDDIAGVDENSPLFEGDNNGKPSFNLDSLDSLELVFLIETEFGIEVPTEDMRRFTTIKEVAKYVEERLKK
jgi:acyl carrier protein